MNLSEFIAHSESKYAVIRTDSYLQDPVAQSLSTSPRQFDYQGVSMTLLSLDPSKVQELADYVQGAVEFELTIGSGKVTLLLHSQALAILPKDSEASS